jgi:type II secretory pathway pseudopilin PulG
MALLSVVISGTFGNAQKKARDSKRIQDMDNVAKAAEQYYSLKGSYVYPGTTAPEDWTNPNGQKLLEFFPSDPKGVGWTQYTYPDNSTAGSGVGNTAFCSCAALEIINSGNSDSISCNFGTGITGPYFCVKNQQ